MSRDPPIQLASNTEGTSRTIPSPPLLPQPTETTTATAPNSPVEPTAMSAMVSAPELGDPRTAYGHTVGHSPSLDVSLMQSSRNASGDSPLHNGVAALESSGGTTSPTDPDSQILEALKSKDRIWVLKLGEMMEALIIERKQPRIDLTPATSYQRMLVHRCSAYYKLVPETDAATKTISVYWRAESRLPARRISELVPPEEFTQPAFKIMRRTVADRRVRSQPESVTGDDGDVSDVETSEAGSVGGRSNAPGSSKRHLTIEEREAAYNEARSRIFMGFEGKDKDKDADKGSSANSSSISLVSGSGSTSAGHSSAGDADESVSSAATESEWSGPAARDRREKRRVGSGGSVPRTLRSGNPYNPPSGSSSSRHSRAASPSFTYASLYDPSAGPYEPSYGAPGPPHGYIQYYYPPYPPPQAPAGPPVMPGYPYQYAHYGFQPSASQHHSDPTSPSEQPYPPPQAQHVGYPQNSYPWGPLPAQVPQNGPPGVSPTGLNPNHPGAPPHATHPPTPQGPLPYHGYFPPPYPPYHVPGYYGAPQFAPPPVPPIQSPSAHVPGYYHDGTQMDNRANGNGVDSSDHSRAASRNSNGHGQHVPVNGNNARKQGMRRQPWSFGPGVTNPMPQFVPGPLTNDAVGPRMSNRRTSGSSTGNRTPGDETSSVASSSTTSSSSQRTFTSTSSKHPLPARPDWAVGLKAQPTLSSGRHHDHSNSNSRTMSPARFGGNLPQLPNQRSGPHSLSQQPPPLADFPPLSSGAGSEKKMPPVGGAWTNSSNMRSALKSGPTGGANIPLINAPMNAPNSPPIPSDNSPVRYDEQENAFERPPPKSNAELFNPKASRRQPVSAGNNGSGSGGASPPDRVAARGLVDMDVLVSKVGSMKVVQGDGADRIPMSSPPSIAVPAGEA